MEAAEGILKLFAQWYLATQWHARASLLAPYRAEWGWTGYLLLEHHRYVPRLCRINKHLDCLACRPVTQELLFGTEVAEGILKPFVQWNLATQWHALASLLAPTAQNGAGMAISFWRTVGTCLGCAAPTILIV